MKILNFKNYSKKTQHFNDKILFKTKKQIKFKILLNILLFFLLFVPSLLLHLTNTGIFIINKVLRFSLLQKLLLLLLFLVRPVIVVKLILLLMICMHLWIFLFFTSVQSEDVEFVEELISKILDYFKRIFKKNEILLIFKNSI